MSTETTDPATGMAMQENAIDTGLQCLMMMTKLHGIAADVAQLQHQFGREKFTAQTVLLAAKKLGLTAKQRRQDPARLDRAALPAIGIDASGEFFLLGKDRGIARKHTDQ